MIKSCLVVFYFSSFHIQYVTTIDTVFTFTGLYYYMGTQFKVLTEAHKRRRWFYSSSDLQRRKRFISDIELSNKMFNFRWSRFQQKLHVRKSASRQRDFSFRFSPDHLLVAVQGLLGHILDEGGVLHLQLPGNRQDKWGWVQDVHLHLGVSHRHVLFIVALRRHLQRKKSPVSAPMMGC